MSEYIIRRTVGIPDWDRIPALPIHNLLWSPQVPICAQGKLCYDDNGIYVKLRADEPHIRAENFGPMDSPCEDSCLEFFFCPVAEDSRYFNIEVNPNGCMYLGFGSGRHDLTRLHPEKSAIIPHVERFEGGWEVSYCIPYSFIRLFFPGYLPISGSSIRANLYKCGDLTVQEHYIAAFPIDLEKPDFHCPKFFQSLKFE